MDMTPERWREIEGLVDQALRLPGPDRARFLIGQCAGDEAKLEQVLDLVLASSEAQAIATPAWVPAAESEDSASDPGAGAEGESLTQAENTATPGPGQRTIGSFHVLRTLGRGGMGTVYLAEQHAPVARQVAIKVAHQPLGSEGRLRLAAERQAMARLTHPNIARMLEAGSTDDGHPYFAMELVDGPPITTYCDEHQLGLEARLRLFLAVCAGVQHAHQKGILHRDLKPTNILVSEIDSKPVPKIIDFGIAKALDQPLIDNTLHTGERILGTPAYLSPEALSSPDGSPTDTRGDVYSLGVLLLELLIGERPFAKAEGETPLSQWRRKTEEDPKSPTRQWLNLDPSSRDTIASQRGSEARTWGRRIRGDLDWIVLRAIAREPAERYPGVSELAADVDRHLKDEPVLAGPPTASYQLRKLVRRHRGPVTFSVLLLFALAGGFVARSLEAARANRQAAEARLAREETEEVVEFLAGLFHAADPDRALGDEVTARQILQAGRERLDDELTDTPRVKARLLHTIAGVYSGLGEANIGLALADEALGLRQQELGPEHPDVAASLVMTARLESEVGNYERSEDFLQQALALNEAKYGKESHQVAAVLKTLGAIHEETARYDEALAIYDRALAIAETIDGPESLDVADLANNLGVVYWRRDDYAIAEDQYRRALAIREKQLDSHHPSVAQTLNNLGDLLRDTERLEEAAKIYQRALEIREQVLGLDHPQLGISLNSLGNLHNALGNWSTAEQLFQQAREIWQQALGPEHDWVAYTLHNLGFNYYAQGRDREAEAMQRQALRINRAALGEDNPRTGTSLVMLGQVLRAQGRLEEAAQALDAARVTFDRPNSSWELAACLTERGLVALEQGDPETAEQFLEEVRSMREAGLVAEGRLGDALLGLAKLEQFRGRPQQAKELARQAIPLLATDFAPSHRHLVEAEQLASGG